MSKAERKKTMRYQKGKKLAELDRRFLLFQGKTQQGDGGFQEELGGHVRGGGVPCLLSLDKNRIVESQIERNQKYYRYAMNLRNKILVGPRENSRDNSLRRTLKVT